MHTARLMVAVKGKHRTKGVETPVSRRKTMTLEQSQIDR